MTSQRFLNDKVNSRDFLRSLREAFLAPAIAMIIFIIQYATPVIGFARELRTNLTYIDLLSKNEIISYFGGAKEDFYYYEDSGLPIIMILCGLIMALTLFSFAFKKNSVNVFFSVGITRTRLYVNRIAAAVTELFAASVIPFFITFIANVSLFGYNPYQLKLFAYYTFIAFTSGVVGLALGAFAASVSGSRIEMIITVASTSGIVVTAAGFLYALKTAFLHGYVETYDIEEILYRLTPWTGINLKGNIDRLVTGTKVPKELLITWKADVLPLVIWLAVSVIVCALGLFLFKKRKNENSNSFGKFDVSSAINGSIVFFGSAMLFSIGLYESYGYQIHSVALCIAICAVAVFMFFFIAELIIRRNIKAVIRMLYVFGGLTLVSVGALIVIGTEYFGTYNKLPDAGNIEYISMSYSDPLNMLSYENPVYKSTMYKEESNKDICKSSDPEDIKLCIEQFNKIKDDKKNDNGIIDYVEFLIKTKDGKFIARSFPVYSGDVIQDYNEAVFNSDYFHQILKLNILYYNDYGNEYEINGVHYQYSYADVAFYTPELYYFDGSLLSDNFNYMQYDFANADEIFAPMMTEELMNALYNDLCKMTYDEYYRNSSEPVGALVQSTNPLVLESSTYTAEYDWVDFYSNEHHYSYDGIYYTESYYTEPYYSESYFEETKNDTIKTGVAVTSILIYPQMTETLRYLNEFEPNPHETAVKSVIYADKKLTLSDAVDNLRDYKWNSNYSNGVFTGGREALEMEIWLNSKRVGEVFAEKPKGNYLDFMEAVYKANGVNLTLVNDTEKADKIADASRMVYDTYKDNGRYVFVIYEDGCIVPMYLPEKALSVLN